MNKVKAKIKTKDGYYDVYDELKDVVQTEINEGKDLDDAVSDAINDHLIYTRDIVELGLHYGVIDDSQIVSDMYEELYNDLYNEDYEVSKWQFKIIDNNLGNEYESFFDYDTEEEAQSAGEDFISDLRDTIETEEDEHGWRALIDFDMTTMEVAAECEDEDQAYQMAENFIDELEIETGRE